MTTKQMRLPVLSLGLAVMTAACQHAAIEFPGVLDLGADGNAAFEEQVIIEDDRRWALMVIPLSRDATHEALTNGLAKRRAYRFITIDEQASPPSKYDWLFSSVRLQVSAERVSMTHASKKPPAPAPAPPPSTLETP